jgi:hypothetical protein
MCSLLDRIFLNCGTSPTMNFVLVAAAAAVLIAFLIKPSS